MLWYTETIIIQINNAKKSDQELKYSFINEKEERYVSEQFYGKQKHARNWQRRKRSSCTLSEVFYLIKLLKITLIINEKLFHSLKTIEGAFC